jgi:hypothetical protein
VVDQYDNVAYAFASFVYQPVSIADIITYLQILDGQIDTLPPGTTLINVNGDRKLGLEEILYTLQKLTEPGLR